jgi:hypothetical protein
MALLNSLMENPRYALMRGVARFGVVRGSVTATKRMMNRAQTREHERSVASRLGATLFPDVDRHAFLRDMQQRGCGFGLRLPAATVAAITRYAESHPVFALREEQLGFQPAERASAEAALGKQILLAQYFNTQRDCAAIGQIAADPLLNWIALRYLGTVPIFLGCNLWWTYPVRASRDDQLKHAHFFHRDIDDFKFIKFFFYLTDVGPGDGAHWVIAGSHRRAPHIRLKDYLLTRRFEDAEISGFYPAQDILEVAGPSGTGFAEDTLCVHKAASPTRKPRLILQLQFALFDLGVGNDGRPASALRMIDGTAHASPA